MKFMKIHMNLIKKYLHYYSNGIKDPGIRYKIVNIEAKNNKYILQCINTSAIFYANITEIISDPEFLNGLHPFQACYLGIEYAKIPIKEQLPSRVKDERKERFFLRNENFSSKYVLFSEDREGNICFIENLTNKSFTMNANEIIHAREFLEGFSANDAFYIGHTAENKRKSLIRRENSFRKGAFGTLKLVGKPLK